MSQQRVLILCTGNSARSQMAEGLLRSMAPERFAVASAGTRPVGLNPLAVKVMQEIGIDISGHRSKPLDEFTGQNFDYVITVCDSARESCPIFLGQARHLHRDFQDPAAVQGREDAKLAAFRRVRQEIREWLTEFLREAK